MYGDRSLRAPARPGRWLALVAGTAVVGLSGCDSTEDPAAPGAAVGAESVSANPAEEVREAELARLEAVVRADLPTVERLHAEDFRLVTPTGDTMTRAALLAALEVGDLDFLALDPVSDLEVRIDGDLAVVTYRADMHLFVDGMGELRHDSWVMVLHERGAEEGRADGTNAWRATREQATAVSGIRTVD